MDVIPLLLPLFMFPGADSFAPVDVYTDGEAVMVNGVVGDGRPLKDGEIATVQFTLGVDGGKELANTAARGLSYSLQMQGTDGGTPLVEALQGMRVGDERTMIFPSQRMTVTTDPVAPKDSQLVLWVRLIGVRAIATVPARPAG